MQALYKTMSKVLITAGYKRIGAAISTHFAQQGWQVHVHARQASSEVETFCNTLAAENKAPVTAHYADLANQGELKRLLLEFKQPLDCIVCNASHFEYDRWEQLNPNLLSESISLSLVAPILLASALKKDRNSSLILILDQKIKNPNADFFSYSAGKFALAGIIPLLTFSLAPIRVNAVAPGLTLPAPKQTQERFQSLHDKTLLGKGNTAEDIAKAVAFLAVAPAITGQTLFVDGGQRFVPANRDGMFL